MSSPVGSITFVHGIGGSPRTFHHQIEAFAGYPLSFVRLPARRSIENGENHGKCDVWSAVASVEQQILQLAHRPRLVVGHSMGGILAALAATRNPQLIDSLIILDSNLPITDEARLSRSELTRLGDPDDQWRRISESLMSMTGTISEADIAEIATGLARVDGSCAYELVRTALSIDSIDLWKRLPVDTTYVASARQLDSEAMTSINARVRVVSLPGGHWPHIESSRDVNDIIRTQWTSLHQS